MSYPIHVLEDGVVSTVIAETKITTANQADVVVSVDGRRFTEHPTRALIWVPEDNPSLAEAKPFSSTPEPPDAPEAEHVNSEEAAE